MKRLQSLVTLLIFLSALWHVADSCSAAPGKILIYTRNQVGPGLYVHDNIKAATAAIEAIAREHSIEVEVTEQPTVFSDGKLQQFKVIVFNNTNNEILDTEEEKAALQRFVRNGGGIVGIHSACGSMRNWPWFWSMMGGKFKRHAKLQPFKVRVADPSDFSTAHLPGQFEWTDEFYFLEHVPDDLHILLAGDLRTLDDPESQKEKEKEKASAASEERPLSWRHEFEGGRAWYTALGHQKEHYSKPRFMKHIFGGIVWAMEGKRKTE